MTHALGRILFAAVLSLWLTTPAWAGFDEGMAAYNRGDYATALEEILPIAEQGNAIAQYNVGQMYLYGEGVPQDNTQASKWWHLAAEQGLAIAQYNLGFMYSSGGGVPQDYAEAVRWYRLAAKQGLAQAQLNLGNIYGSGGGVPQDYAEAVRWYRLAAEQGNAIAQYNLGNLYAQGQGVPQDYTQAEKWYRLAAEQGLAQAQDNLDDINAKSSGYLSDFISFLPLFLMINMIVLIHLSGHFIASRLLGIRIEIVSIGFGPKIISFTRNDTIWHICWLPIGGYIRSQTAITDKGKFVEKMSVLLFGSIFNIIFAFVVFFILFTTIGVLTIQGGEEFLVKQSITDGFIEAVRVLVWTWTTWPNDAAGALSTVYDSGAVRVICTAAIWSSQFGILNLLPLPKLDGWRVLRLTLAASTSPDRTEVIMLWAFRLIVASLALAAALATWNDLVQLGVVDFFINLLS